MKSRRSLPQDRRVVGSNPFPRIGMHRDEIKKNMDRSKFVKSQQLVTSSDPLPIPIIKAL